MAHLVVGVFDTHEKATHGIEELRGTGFSPAQISIFAPDPREVDGFADELGVRLAQGTIGGAAAGGIVGGLGGWLLGLTALTIPGAGVVLAAGPVVGAIMGMVGGSVLGGFIGILVGLGIPRHAAEEYNRELLASRTLVIVHAGDLFADAELALNQAGALGIRRYEEELPSGKHSEVVFRGPIPDSTEHVKLAAPDSEGVEAGRTTEPDDQSLDDADLVAPRGRVDI
jgi:hypothetical protein